MKNLTLITAIVFISTAAMAQPSTDYKFEGELGGMDKELLYTITMQSNGLADSKIKAYQTGYDACEHQALVANNSSTSDYFQKVNTDSIRIGNIKIQHPILKSGSDKVTLDCFISLK